MAEPRAPRLAIIGADEPLGEALLRALEDADQALESCLPVTLGEDEAVTVEYAGRELTCLEPADLDWSRIDAAVIASANAGVGPLAKLAWQHDLPLFCPRAMLPWGLEGARVQADAPAIALGRVLAPVAAAAGLDSAHVFVGLPVAALGKAGVDELAHQTQALFAMQPVDSQVLPVRLAFNLLPVSAFAGLEREAALIGDLRAMLGLPALPAQASLAWVPVFHGGSAFVQVRVRRATSVPEMRQMWEGVEGLTIMDEAMPGGVPTPATDTVDSDSVFIGRIQVSPDDATLLSCWLCFDHPRLEAARIASALAEWSTSETGKN